MINYKNNIKNKNNKGQSLFELMMAVLITAITLVAIISLVGSSISNTTFARDRTQAARFTNEGIEWLRGQRDLDWFGFVSNGSPDNGSVYCLSGLELTAIGSCIPIVDTKFTREAVIIYDAAVEPSAAEVRVITSWEDSGGKHESRISTSFTNWRTR